MPAHPLRSDIISNYYLFYVRNNANMANLRRCPFVPKTRVIIFQDEDGRAPFLEWFDQLPPKAQDKCRVRLERLAQLGHELRRPEADYLRDQIYELRIGLQGINYRILYFFHRNLAAVLSHGLVKERAVPPAEIDLAIKRKRKFTAHPDRHTYQE